MLNVECAVFQIKYDALHLHNAVLLLKSDVCFFNTDELRLNNDTM